MTNQLEYICVYRPGDEKVYRKHKAQLSALPDAELQKHFRRAEETGVVGARAQALQLAALHKIAQERGLDCPIVIHEGGRVISIKEPETGRKE